MNFITPITQNVKTTLPHFALHGNEIICPQKLYKKNQYPKLSCDMVKIIGQNGQNIFIPLHKLNFNLESE